jgi:hypothetical protein
VEQSNGIADDMGHVMHRHKEQKQLYREIYNTGKRTNKHGWMERRKNKHIKEKDEMKKRGNVGEDGACETNSFEVLFY